MVFLLTVYLLVFLPLGDKRSWSFLESSDHQWLTCCIKKKIQKQEGNQKKNYPWWRIFRFCSGASEDTQVHTLQTLNFCIFPLFICFQWWNVTKWKFKHLYFTWVFTYVAFYICKLYFYDSLLLLHYTHFTALVTSNFSDYNLSYNSCPMKIMYLNFSDKLKDSMSPNKLFDPQKF